MKRTLLPQDLSHLDLHQYLLGCVAPRPIAFVSSYDEEGIANLSPYSYFMAISSKPPLVAFSAATPSTERRTKDTLHNARVQQELTINGVSYDIVHQMAMTAVSFPPEVDEFKKSGLTPVDAHLVNAPMVKESPFNLECKVVEIKSFGTHPGSGNLVICEVLLFHIKEEAIGEKQRIDPRKADLMGRMNRAYYTRASGPSIHTILQPSSAELIGFENLPRSIKESKNLSAWELCQLASVRVLPSQEEIEEWQNQLPPDPEKMAKDFIQSGDAIKALALLMAIS